MQPLFSSGTFTVIAALHLPPFFASANPDAVSTDAITEYALRNTRYAVNAGVKAVYLQDLGDYPVGPHILPHTVAGVTAVGAALRREFPDLILGICLFGHGAREPLAIAQAIGASFVRLKVYVGAMVKAEGLVQGCAYEAIQYRAQLKAENIAILADVYDRTGEPLGRMPLAEEARQAATFGRADGLVLTGRSLDESEQMLSEVRAARINVPLLLGGGATPETIGRIRGVANGVVVSTAFKSVGGWSRESLSADWDEDRIAEFMRSLE
jgi:membrane complex biogenesis BtpA family protein